MNADGDATTRWVVNLEVRSDTDPLEWDWPTLLDLPDHDDVAVLSDQVT